MLLSSLRLLTRIYLVTDSYRSRAGIHPNFHELHSRKSISSVPSQTNALTSPLPSPRRLSQIHSLLITTDFHSRYPSALLSVLRLYLSTSSTFARATILFPQVREPNKWNLVIRDASATSPLRALHLFKELSVVMEKDNGSNPCRDDPFIYASLIKACNKVQAFREGKSIHCHVIRFGLDYNVNILNSLVSFYMGSGNLIDYAAVLFGSVQDKSVASVNCMISGYVGRGSLGMGLSLFVEMLRSCFGSNVKPNYVTFVVLISCCVEFGEWRTANALHSCCCKMGLDCNTEICNVLIDLYAKSGCVSEAATVFRDTQEKDLVSWNAVIWGYANSGDLTQAFSLFRKMRISDIGTDRVSLSCLLSACATNVDLPLGEMLHAHVKATGLEHEVSVGTALINMYTKCGLFVSARKLFDDLSKQNIESWNAMIHSYIENGLAWKVLNLFDQIKSRELEPDEVTILGLIMAIRDTGEVNKCTPVHSMVEGNELYSRSIVLRNALIDMYAKCGCMIKARGVFDRMVEKDVVSWTSMIVGHAINGGGNKSLDMFHQMCAKKLVPNAITFIGVLSACGYAGLVDEGRKLYNMMYEVYHMQPQIEHCGCMIDMLARAGMIGDAKKFILEMPVEPNALIWRMMVNSCKVHGRINLGLNFVKGVTELNSSRDSANFVISSNMYAEAGRWAEVIAQRNFMVFQKAVKKVGKSYVAYLTE